MAKNIKIKPLAGYALVKPEETEEKTASGLYLPDNAQERPARGTVVAIGEAVRHPDHEEKAQFGVGDIVIYKKWGGDELKADGQDYKLVKFDDVMAIVE
jgi:chaperonin GroES